MTISHLPRALVAQWIERLRPKEGVGSSILSKGAKAPPTAGKSETRSTKQTGNSERAISRTLHKRGFAFRSLDIWICFEFRISCFEFARLAWAPGEVAEWSKAAVSKTVMAQVIQGSNPCLSASNHAQTPAFDSPRWFHRQPRLSAILCSGFRRIRALHTTATRCEACGASVMRHALRSGLCTFHRLRTALGRSWYHLRSSYRRLSVSEYSISRTGLAVYRDAAYGILFAFA